MSFPAYIICATQRSGSTLLCDLLTASGVAGQPHSYFRTQDIGYWAGLWGVSEPTKTAEPKFSRDYIAAMRRAGTADTGVFGLRLMWDSVAEAEARLQAALGGEAEIASCIEQAFGSTLFIHLSRRDKVAQAVSLVRAEQTGLWHADVDGAERERTAPPQAPVFDAARITQTCDKLASDDAGWQSFFAVRGIQPLRLTYEELAADPQTILAATLKAIGRDQTTTAGINVRTAKLADAISMEWIERMRLK